MVELTEPAIEHVELVGDVGFKSSLSPALFNEPLLPDSSVPDFPLVIAAVSSRYGAVITSRLPS